MKASHKSRVNVNPRQMVILHLLEDRPHDLSPALPELCLVTNPGPQVPGRPVPYLDCVIVEVVPMHIHQDGVLSQLADVLLGHLPLPALDHRLQGLPYGHP